MFQEKEIKSFFKNRVEKLSLFDFLNLPSFNLWLLHLGSLTPPEKEIAHSLLNEEEKKNVQQLRQEGRRELFIIRRALSKIILSDYMHQATSLINFSYNPYKKPYLKDYPNLHFNISHRKNYALLAVDQGPLGVDIEEVKEIDNFLDLLDYFASPLEKKWVGESLTRFFILWTIKEALMKAEGTGFLRESIIPLTVLPLKNEKDTFYSASQEYNVYTSFWNHHIISLAFKKEV